MTTRTTARAQARHPWWRVMCLSGVDYFSTLGYQPGIAALAAGALAPIATVVLIAVTLLGAVPVYRRIARESPDGEGSMAVLARFLPGWRGKLIILVLLGFAATDFMITITMSASDAGAHLLHSTSSPWILPVTVVLVLSLMVVFWRGFTEAIRVSVLLVVVFLTVNLIVLVAGIGRILDRPETIDTWISALTTAHPEPLSAALMVLIVFPKLALGLSGFETGVSVMPQIDGGAAGREGRIRGGRRLLLTSALIMSVYLVLSSVVTTLLIPAAEFREGGAANGRALAYLAHELLGPAFGTVYDIATIAILWFAGASAMAGLLSLFPRYLPRFGMAPEWARRSRPMVLVLGGLAVVITVAFRADVNAQSAAYATGVLVLIGSATVAVLLSARRTRQRGAVVLFSAIAVIIGYTLVANVIERPDGLRIAVVFILGVLAVSLFSRVNRNFELRRRQLTWDRTALRMVQAAATGDRLNLVAHSADIPQPGADPSAEADEYAFKERDIRSRNNIPDDEPLVLVEVEVRDPSEFSCPLEIRGRSVDGLPVLRVRAAAVPNALAAVALDIRDSTGAVPDLWFDWSPRNPLVDGIRYLLFGQGQNAAVTHEILRRAERDEERRPAVHVS